MTHQERYQLWNSSPALAADEQAELAAIAADAKEIESRFFQNLEFGTAGLRGTMGMGTNRMNVYVIRHATQAFAEVINAEGPEAAKKGIAICYDCRNNGDKFAEEAASVMAANGIPSYLFEAMRPTPELSFAVREYGCIAGINVTASHNPKEYNGYKVYWEDGAQLPPHHAAAIAKKMEELDVFASIKTMPFAEAKAQGFVTMLGAETDEKFLANVMAQVNDAAMVARVADRFKMVYTPFHGTGYQLIPETLRRLGMKQVIGVPEQMIPDGNFSSVASPNPENVESFALAIALAEKEGADFILGSDPDADRVGIVVRNKDGNYVAISGNQTGVLLLDYLIGAKKRAGTLPAHAVALKTIVTTEMARAVAETNGVICFDTFTGFKFMAEKKNALEATGEGKVIFSYEESYGYMLGDYVRDKDAVTAALLLTEMAAWYYDQGMTLYDALQLMYETYGIYGEKTLNLVMPGLDGLAKMKELMASLRANPITDLGGTPVAIRKDYADGTETDVATGAVIQMELVGSNVLKYHLTDGTAVIVRPSGTEPKVKVYILAKADSRADCDERIARYEAWANGLAK